MLKVEYLRCVLIVYFWIISTFPSNQKFTMRYAETIIKGCNKHAALSLSKNINCFTLEKFAGETKEMEWGREINHRIEFQTHYDNPPEDEHQLDNLDGHTQRVGFFLGLKLGFSNSNWYFQKNHENDFTWSLKKAAFVIFFSNRTTSKSSHTFRFSFCIFIFTWHFADVYRIEMEEKVDFIIDKCFCCCR